MASQPPPIPPTASNGVSSQPAAAGAAAIALPEEELCPEISFWQQPFAQNILPFITSLLLHLGLMVLIIVTAEAIKQVVFVPKEQVIIPDVEGIESTGPEGGIPHPGLGGDPERDAAQNLYPDVPKDSPGLAEKPGPSLLPSLTGGGAGDSASDGNLIGIGPGGLGKGKGIGSGTGEGLGSGTGDGSGVLAPFGVPGGGGGIGPKSNFWGSRGNARRIAYVCDASGSMLNMFDNLRFELRISIEKLSPAQSFNVIFFQDPGCAAADKQSLVPATADKKRAAFEFLDKFTVHGLTNPIPALEMAFSQKPDLIYMLTDGDFNGPGNDAVVNFCKQKTAETKTKINTLAFINRSAVKDNPQELEYVKALKAIADNSGGVFKYVSDEEMGPK